MSDGITIRIRGIKELRDAFFKLPDMVRAEINAAMDDSLAIIRARAQREHRFKSRSGRLEKAIVGERISDYPVARGVVRVDESVAPHGFWVHDGTKPHEIKPRPPKKWLRWVGDAGGIGTRVHFARGVHHPGTKPDQFLYQAARAERRAIVERFRRGVAEAQRKAGF